MPEMPSADMRTTVNHPIPIRGPEFNISSKEVEGLVLEIKENLRLSATSMKALPCSHLSRKSSRASPYRVPGKLCSGGGGDTCAPTATCDTCLLKTKRSHSRMLHAAHDPEDPYELLQKLLRDGSLVNEAVRRVQLGLSPKQRYFYESEENSPVLRLYSQDS